MKYVFSLVLVLVLPATAASAGPQPVRRQQQAMGTLVEITVYTDDEPRALAAMDAAFAEFSRLEGLMTDWREDSTIGRLNAAAGDGRWIALDPDTDKVVAKSIDTSRLTGGAFDVTVGVFRGLWKFDRDIDQTLPSPAAVRERRRLVGWRDLLYDPARRAARLRRPGQRITLGGIAKGYAVDRATEKLRASGLRDFMVQAGGDFFASGHHGDRPWRVGIRDPRGPREQFFAFLEVYDQSFSTSGDYERFVLRDGRRYHHILDPKTGFPAMRSRSVTVLAPNAFEADALDTALFVLGPQRALALLRRERPGIEAVIVDAQNRVQTTAALRNRLVWVGHPTDAP